MSHPPAASLPITNDLLGRILNLESTGRNDLELKRIENDAKKLIQAGGELVSDGYVVLGAVATYRLDADEADRCFNSARHYVSINNRVPFYTNRAISLHRTYRHQAALNGMIELVENHYDDLRIFPEAINIAICSMRPDIAETFYEKAIKLNPNFGPHPFKAKEALFLDKVRTLGIPLDAITERLDVVGELLLREKIMLEGANIMFASDASCLYEFEAKISAERASELNFAIAENLAERFDDPLDSVVVFSTCPYPEPEIEAAS